MEKIVLSEQTLSNLIREIETSLLSRYRFTNGVITGQEILKFAPHKQINNFILFQIYQDWNAHVQKFRHPYFDFDHTDVNEALTRFLNTLSRHIQIKEADFRTMLEKAIYNTLKLILNPNEVFSKFFFLNQENIPLDLFKKHAPYFSDYDFIIQSILKFYDKNQVRVVEKKVFFEKMDRVITIFESRENNSIDKYRKYLFNKATGKDLESVLPSAFEKPAKELPKVKLEESPKKPLRTFKPEPPAPRQEVKPEPPKPKPTPPPARKPEPVPAEPKVELKRSLPEIPQPQPKPVAPEISKAPEPPVQEQYVKDKDAASIKEALRGEPKAYQPSTPATPTPPPAAQQPTTPAKPEPAPEPNFKTEPVPEPEVKPNVEEKAPASSDEPKSLHQVLAERNQQASKTPSIAEQLTQRKGDQKSIADRFRKEETPVSSNPEHQSKPEPAPESESNSEPEPKPQLTQNPTPAPKPEPEPAPEPPPKPEGLSFQAPEKPSPEIDAAEIAASMVLEQDQPVEPETSSAAEEEVASEPKGFDLFSPPPGKEPVSLFSDSEAPVAGHRYQSEDQPKALHESLAPKKSIKIDQIPVHKQFQFVQKLFGGQNVKFKVVLDKLNETGSLAEAEEVMDKYIFNAPNTRRTDKLSQEFILLVKNRFGV